MPQNALHVRILDLLHEYAVTGTPHVLAYASGGGVHNATLMRALERGELDAGIYEFMKAFRDDRLSKMDSGDISVSLAEGPTTVLHVLPASAFEPGASVNLSTVAHERSVHESRSLRDRAAAGAAGSRGRAPARRR